jgi:hypothetical protein
LHGDKFSHAGEAIKAQQNERAISYADKIITARREKFSKHLACERGRPIGLPSIPAHYAAVG